MYLRHAGAGAVVERRDGQAQRALGVALREELLTDELTPAAARRPRSRRVADVSALDGHLPSIKCNHVDIIIQNTRDKNVILIARPKCGRGETD